MGDAHTSYPSYAHPHAKAQQDSGSDVSDDWERQKLALNDVVQIGSGNSHRVFFTGIEMELSTSLNDKIVI